MSPWKFLSPAPDCLLLRSGATHPGPLSPAIRALPSPTWELQAGLCVLRNARNERASPAFEIHSMYPLSSRSICCCLLSFRKARRFSTRSLSLANSLQKQERARCGCCRHFRECVRAHARARVCVCLGVQRSLEGRQWTLTQEIMSPEISEHHRGWENFCQLPTLSNNCTQVEEKRKATEPCHANNCWLHTPF